MLTGGQFDFIRKIIDIKYLRWTLVKNFSASFSRTPHVFYVSKYNISFHKKLNCLSVIVCSIYYNLEFFFLSESDMTTNWMMGLLLMNQSYNASIKKSIKYVPIYLEKMIRLTSPIEFKAIQ